MKSAYRTLGRTASVLCSLVLVSQANSQVIFSDDFEGPESAGWAKWTGYPNATVSDNQNRSVETTGNAIFGAPAEVTFSAYQGTNSGKLWQLYWYEGLPENGGNNSATFMEWTGSDMTALQGAQIQFDLQSFTSQYDSYASGNSQAYMFVKFFNADYTYFYDWAFYTELLSDNTTNAWMANTLTFTVPIDAAIMQVGVENAQFNWGGGSVYVDNAVISVVPEPTAFALAGLGAAALLIFRRRR